MGGKSCQNCMEFKKGDCLGTGVCSFYKAAPSGGASEYWPKEMRSRTSYAGSNPYYEGSKRSLPDVKKKSYAERQNTIKKEFEKKAKRNDELVKTTGFKRLNCCDLHSVSELIRYLDGEVIAWISYDTNPTIDGPVYNANCMLQYKNAIRRIVVKTSRKQINRAMLDGVLEVAAHITRPCNVSLVTDRALININRINEDNLVQKIFVRFSKMGCHIKEICIKDNDIRGIIENQIRNPVIIKKNDMD